MRRRDCGGGGGGGGPRSRAPPGHSPGSHQSDAGDLPKTPPAVAARCRGAVRSQPRWQAGRAISAAAGLARRTHPRRGPASPAGERSPAPRAARPAGSWASAAPIGPRSGLRSEFRAGRGRRSQEGGGGLGGGGGGGGGLRRSALGRPTLLPAALQQPPQITSGARAGGAGRQPALPVCGVEYSMAVANKGSPAAGEVQWYSLLADLREPPASRGAITSQGRAGIPVSRCFCLPRTLRGSWRKKGRGRSPSCFWGLLGSLASVFHCVPCIVACRGLSPGR